MQVLKIHDANVFMNKIPGSMLNLPPYCADHVHPFTTSSNSFLDPSRQ